MKYSVLLIFILLACNSNHRNNQEIETAKSEDSLAAIEMNEDTLENTVPAKNEIIDSLFYDVQLYEYHNDRYYDTTIHIDSLKDLFHDFSKFNYTELKRKRNKDKSLTLYNDSIKIIIEEALFDSSKHVLTYEDGGGYTKIDGKVFYGSDGFIPRRKISGITFYNHDYKKVIEKDYYSDLYEPNLHCYQNPERCYTFAYIKDSDEIIVTMSNSDGAGSYEVVFIFDIKGNIKRRIIGYAW